MKTPKDIDIYANLELQSLISNYEKNYLRAQVSIGFIQLCQFAENHGVNLKFEYDEDEDCVIEPIIPPPFLEMMAKQMARECVKKLRIYQYDVIEGRHYQVEGFLLGRGEMAGLLNAAYQLGTSTRSMFNNLRNAGAPIGATK